LPPIRSSWRISSRVAMPLSFNRSRSILSTMSLVPADEMRWTKEFDRPVFPLPNCGDHRLISFRLRQLRHGQKTPPVFVRSIPKPLELALVVRLRCLTKWEHGVKDSVDGRSKGCVVATRRSRLCWNALAAPLRCPAASRLTLPSGGRYCFRLERRCLADRPERPTSRARRRIDLTVQVVPYIQGSSKSLFEHPGSPAEIDDGSLLAHCGWERPHYASISAV